MKNLTTKLMIAAALVAAAGVASAQTLEANIPFAFRADGKVMAAGTYRVTVQHGAGGPIIALSGVNRDHLLSLAIPEGQAKSEWKAADTPMLSFSCGVSRCALKYVWMGGGELTYKVPTPSIGRDEPAHTAEIAMHAVKGD